MASVDRSHGSAGSDRPRGPDRHHASAEDAQGAPSSPGRVPLRRYQGKNQPNSQPSRETRFKAELVAVRQILGDTSAMFGRLSDPHEGGFIKSRVKQAQEAGVGSTRLVNGSFNDG